MRNPPREADAVGVAVAVAAEAAGQAAHLRLPCNLSRLAEVSRNRLRE
jgi:hypothetical protein